jgi:hypothetical protein
MCRLTAERRNQATKVRPLGCRASISIGKEKQQSKVKGNPAPQIAWVFSAIIQIIYICEQTAQAASC